MGPLGNLVFGGHPSLLGPTELPRILALQDWPKSWRAKLKQSPGDLSLVANLVSYLLR